MPERILREGILTSDRVCSLSWPAEVFYRRLMSVVDDYGRFDGRLSVLRARLYALQLDKATEPDIGKWRLETAKAGLVRVYSVEGKEFVQMEDFKQRIQSKSKWPAPPEVPRGTGAKPESTVVHGESPKPTAYVDVDVGCEVGVGVVGVPPPADAPRMCRGKKTILPPDFTVSNRVQEWATEKGHTHLEEHLEAFKRKALARGYQYVDWDSAFMEAIRENWAKIGQRSGFVGRTGTEQDWMNFRSCIRDQKRPDDERLLGAIRTLGGLDRLGQMTSFEIERIRPQFDEAIVAQH